MLTMAMMMLMIVVMMAVLLEGTEHLRGGRGIDPGLGLLVVAGGGGGDEAEGEGGGGLHWRLLFAHGGSL